MPAEIKIYGNNRLQQLGGKSTIPWLDRRATQKGPNLVSIKRIIIPKFLSDFPKH